MPFRHASTKACGACRRPGPSRYSRGQSRSPRNPIGVKGYAPNHAFVIQDETEVAGLPELRCPLVVSQTTIKAKTFFDTAEAIKSKTKDKVEIVNTKSRSADRETDRRPLGP